MRIVILFCVAAFLGWAAVFAAPITVAQGGQKPAPVPVAEGAEKEVPRSTGGKAPKTLGPPPLEARPQAFAAAYSVESALETCRADDALKAGNCALTKCTKATAHLGSSAEPCRVVAACDSGWGGIMGVALGEAHFATALCGARTKEALLAAMKEYCRGYLPYVRLCDVGTLYSPQGQEEEAPESQVWEAKDFAGRPLD